jgi:hypothetical protein
MLNHIRDFSEEKYDYMHAKCGMITKTLMDMAYPQFKKGILGGYYHL